MGRNDRDAFTTETIAIGIKGDRHSLCGAIKRLELNGQQWNGLLSLKEQCARRIALLKSEQLKCFITGYLSPNLFKYVTKDIFNLRRDEFVSKYPKPLYMCQECTMDSYENPPDDCQCPQMDAAIDALNKCIFKQMNDRNKKIKTNNLKEFRFIYKIPNDGQDHSYQLEKSTSVFLYFSPTYYNGNGGSDYGIFDRYYLINSQISTEDKLLFVDAMRFFGGFRSYCEEPQIIFYRRREYCL